MSKNLISNFGAMLGICASVGYAPEFTGRRGCMSKADKIAKRECRSKRKAERKRKKGR